MIIKILKNISELEIENTKLLENEEIVGFVMSIFDQIKSQEFMANNLDFESNILEFLGNMSSIGSPKINEIMT